MDLDFYIEDRIGRGGGTPQRPGFCKARAKAKFGTFRAQKNNSAKEEGPAAPPRQGVLGLKGWSHGAQICGTPMGPLSIRILRQLRYYRKPWWTAEIRARPSRETL